ncbi:hypothetical protein LDG_8928 [Legionella drancourtii LLAP12]|uniref:Uncharacterized protein n=1 Tax=Legionella drancourtii LLAP12 TaxID=658187 RepID=G9EUD5_9GAMM|nr:hypothetical protein LDG_8928 [Legionella drancourtii LLAP12]
MGCFSMNINLSGTGYFSSIANSSSPLMNIWGQDFSTVGGDK